METKKEKQWPWGIGLFYVVFVLSLLVFLFFSFYNTWDLVEENYYQKDITYQQQIDRMAHANALSSKPTFVYSKTKKQIVLSMPAQFTPNTLRGKILFFKPADKAKDVSINLICNDQNKQVIPTTQLGSGMWRIKFTWSDAEKSYYMEEVIEL